MIVRRASYRLCGARTRARVGRCKNRVPPGLKRCRFHGGLSTGPKTAAGKARVVAAMGAAREGVKRWRARMHALKVAGLIDRFPQGRKSRGAAPTPRMRARALGIADELVEALPRILAADITTPEGKIIHAENRTAAERALDELETFLT